LRITRREFIKLLVEGAAGLGLLRFVSLVPLKGQADVVRPPGAVVEEQFNSLCVRCGICLEVCPTKAIVLAGFDDGIEAVDTPKIDPLSGPCEFFRGRCQEVMRCSKSCPTGALQTIDRKDVKLGSVEFDPGKCLAYKGKECIVCDEMCPVFEAITLTEDLKPVFHEEKCVGCGTCVHACPADPKALVLLPKGAKRVVW